MAWAKWSVLVVVMAACGGGDSGGTASISGGISTAGDDGDGSGATAVDDGDDDGVGTTGSTASHDDVDPDSTGSPDTTAADSEDEDTGPPPGVTLLFLSIDPPDSIFELDLGEAASQPFTVNGHYDDGNTYDVTAMVDSWVVSNPMVGAMNDATLQIPGFATSYFGSTILTATFESEEGQAQVTVAAYNKTGADQDFFFVLPYLDPAGDQSKPLTFSTDVKALDVFFNMDTTVSMGGPIANLQSSLAGTVIPGISAQVPDTHFGAGIFEDFPVSPFGHTNCNVYPGQSGPDQPFELLQAITNDAVAVQGAVNSMALLGTYPVGCGGDTPESHIEALYQIATGEGLNAPGLTLVPANNAGIGGVGFRDGSMPVIVSITDAESHENPGNFCVNAGGSYGNNAGVAAVAHDRTDMYDALDSICARVVPVAVGNFGAICGPLADGTEFATTTRAVVPPEAWDFAPGGRPAGCAANQCCTGLSGVGVATNNAGMCPLVYRAAQNGSGLGQSIVDGLQMVAAYSPVDVTTSVAGVGTDTNGVALPAGTTTADFIKAVTPFGHGAVPLPGVPDPTMTATTFENVIPDTDVTFSIVAYNDFVPQGNQPRLFVATITVLADGCYDLDEREVFILVPPQELPPPG